MGVKYGIYGKIFAIEKIPMQFSVHLYSRPSRVSLIMLPFSIVAIFLPPHLVFNNVLRQKNRQRLKILDKLDNQL